jgi:competence protein ComEC
MSFAATAALIAGYAAWGEWRGRQTGRPPRGPVSRPRQALGTTLRYAGGLAMTSLVAGTATALYAAWHFQRVSSLGLVANLSTMPIVSFIVMPAMVVGAVLMPFGLDGPAFTLMGKGIALFLAISMELARHSPFDAVGIVPAAAVAFLTAALVILTLATTWLRLAAVPFALAGAALVILRPLPDLLISEDAQLVALRLSGNAVAVNRKRPNAFTLQEWSRAMMTEATVPPAAAAMPVLPEDAGEAPFSCSADLCVARHRSGAVVVHSRNAAAAAALCNRASLIVIDDATARNPCAGTAATVLTKRDLARRGAASVTFGKVEESEEGERSRLHVDYAVSRPYRPWHAQRAFSREARGLAPYRNARQERKGPEGKGQEGEGQEGKGHDTERRDTQRQDGAAQQGKERGQGSKRAQDASQRPGTARQDPKEPSAFRLHQPALGPEGARQHREGAPAPAGHPVSTLDPPEAGRSQ